MAKIEFTLYAPKGVKVTVSKDVDTAENAFATVKEFLAAGFAVDASEASAGDIMEVSAVIRGQVTNDGVTKDRIYMYAPWGSKDKGSQLTHYLNTPEDLAAFEAVSGLKVSSLPVQRGKAGPIKDSTDFENNHRPVNFRIEKEKVDDEKSPVGYRWQLIRYVTDAPLKVLDKQQQPSQPVGSQPERKAAGAEGQQTRKASTTEAKRSWTNDEIANWWKSINEQHEGLTKEAILAALNVNGLSDWRGTAEEATKCVQEYLYPTDADRLSKVGF